MLIIIYHHLSSFIIIYHHLSSFIIIYHHLSSFIIIYHHLSSFIIIYHHLSSFIIIYPADKLVRLYTSIYQNAESRHNKNWNQQRICQFFTKASLLAGVCFPLGMYWGQSFWCRSDLSHRNVPFKWFNHLILTPPPPAGSTPGGSMVQQACFLDKVDPRTPARHVLSINIVYISQTTPA